MLRGEGSAERPRMAMYHGAMPERPRQSDGRVHGVIVALRDASEGRFLLIRRALGVASGGKIAFPGGAVEPGEPLQDAAVREAAEELGWSVRVRGPVWQRVFDDRPLTLWGFVGLWVEGDLRPDPAEVAETMWLTRAEIAGFEEANEALIGTGDFADAAARAWRNEATTDRPVRREGERASTLDRRRAKAVADG